MTTNPEQLAVGRLLIAKRLEAAESIAESKLLRLNDQVVIYNDGGRLLSDVAEATFVRWPKVQVVCGFHFKVNSDGRMLLVCALRGRRDGIDVSEIARRHGGGGHHSAAGFGLEVDEQMANPVAVIGAALC